MNYRFVIAVLTEYLRSLHFHHIAVEPYLNELLINLLVRNKQFYQLHQLLQYHVIGDFVHVACQLLAIESSYPPAYQLALDMFKRLKTNEEILEVLVTKKQVTVIDFIWNESKDNNRNTVSKEPQRSEVFSSKNIRCRFVCRRSVYFLYGLQIF